MPYFSSPRTLSKPVPSAPPQDRLRLPEWLRIQLPTSSGFGKTRSLLEELKLNTVCQSARCPNHWECWSKGTATFMIGGERCTRACAFCAVITAKPLPLEEDEPDRVAEATRRMNLRHLVITGVARDDLPDGGANHFRCTIERVRALNPGIIIEVLTSDFAGSAEALEEIFLGRPEVFNHNIETVRRLTPKVRSRATYEGSLEVLRRMKGLAGSAILTKSGLMLGLGETEEELFETLQDLRAVGCDILTLGQYLQPSLHHLPVVEYISPQRFEAFGLRAKEMGFSHVSSAPMVRSSYHADELQLPSRAVK